jgi:acyl-CoA thioester hydrolase
MAFIHWHTFPIRHYECDAYGHVNHANYLRYMQEAAFGATHAVGFSPQAFAERNLMWVAYETDIEYIAQLVYGDTLHVKTWVEDFRRVRSLRQYELYRDEQLIARAHTDWVLLDTQKLTPVSIPSDIVEAYAAGDPVEPPASREKLPTYPKIPDNAFRMRRSVAWRDLDPVGHVNNAVYLHYTADCGMQIAKNYGWSMLTMRDRGYGNVARRHTIEYKNAAQLDDELEISTWITHMRRASAIRHYVIKRVHDDKLIARIRTLAIWINLETKQPARIPQAYREAFADNLVAT